MKLFLSIIFTVFLSGLMAQVELTRASMDIVSLEDIYDLQINNPSGDNINLSITVEIRQHNQLIYQARTNTYSLSTPMAVLSLALLQPIQVQRNTIGEVDGEYEVLYRVEDAVSGTILSTERYLLTADGGGMRRGTEQGRGIDFQYSGRATIIGQWSDSQGLGSEVPRNYVRAELHPDFALYGIPVGLDALWSTEQSATRQSINQVALRFDVQQFRRQMQSRMQSKLKEIEAIGSIAQVNDLQALKDKVMVDKFPKLKEWEAQLADPKIQEGLQQLKQLKSLQQVINNPEVRRAIARHAHLKALQILNNAQKDELSKLTAFISEINKIRAKASEIKTLADQYRKYQDLAKKIAQAKRYANTGLFKDPRMLQQGLKSLDLLRGPEEWLNGFDAIEIGTSYPYYSRLTLSSLSVNGVNVEWNPGQLYVAATYGQSSRRTFTTNTSQQQNNWPQTTMAAKLGYGSPSDNHIHLTWMNILDSYKPPGAIPTAAQQNRVMAVDASWNLWNRKVLIGGEWAASQMFRDRSVSNSLDGDLPNENSPLAFALGQATSSSSYDVAWRFFTDLDLLGNNTKIKGSVERVGASYYTLGTPNLLNDVLRWKAEVKQSLFDKKLSFSAFARQDDNDLEPLLTSSQSKLSSFGISGVARFNKWPIVNFSYAPYAQKAISATDGVEQNTDATVLNISAGYPLAISKQLQSYTQLTYMHQDLASSISDINHNLDLFGISQSLTYQRSNLNVAVNYTPSQIINDTSHEVLTINANLSSQLFGKLNGTLGWQYLSISKKESRTGLQAMLSYPINKYLSLDWRVNRNLYHVASDIDGTRDLVSWMALNVNW